MTGAIPLQRRAAARLIVQAIRLHDNRFVYHRGMAKLLLNLSDVPEDEADDVRGFLDAGGIGYYETRPSFWGISSGGIWIRDDRDIAEAKRLMAEYQRSRQARAREDRDLALRNGTAQTFIDVVRTQPLRVLLTVIGIAFLLLLTALPVLLLQRSPDLDVRGTAFCELPSGETCRSFQMTLMSYPYLEGGVHWVQTAPYEDVSMFTSDNTDLQPPGRSIMNHEQWRSVDVSSLRVDWSRILAVAIDEPFAEEVAPYSLEPSARECDAQRAGVLDSKERLVSVAAAVHAVAPQARLWVLFTGKEVELMRRRDCPLDLNDTTFDVVSVSKYEVEFSELRDHYDWFVSRWPQQQLALVPATAYANDDSPRAVADRLKGYFEYANEMNADGCDMGLGRVGRTENYDGCRVWIVAGWMSVPDFPHHGGWHSLLWQGSPQFQSGAPILNAWSSELAKVRR
jgi:hypothetical protein